MFYSCLPASSRTASSRKSGALRARAATGRRSATVDIHCHVMTPEAAELTKHLSDPTREAMLSFSSPATREVNRRQDETVRDQLTQVGHRHPGGLTVADLLLLDGAGARARSGAAHQQPDRRSRRHTS
jgi:hypothetical protein